MGVGDALVVGITVWRDTMASASADLPIVKVTMEVTMQAFDGDSSWSVEGTDAVLTLTVRIPLARVNNCLQGKQLKAADKVTDAAKAFTNACYTSARCIIATLTGTARTAQAQVFSAQLQVFASGVPLANASAATISPAEYAALIASGGNRV